jgi:imidazolonepropionase-like amidohydrolase
MEESRSIRPGLPGGPPHRFASFRRRTLGLLGSLLLAPACGDAAPENGEVQAFVNAVIVDGTGAPALESGVILVRDGRIEAVGPEDQVQVPSGARVVDLDGRWLLPGFINAHGHVGGVRGLESGPHLYTRSNILEQLGRYARYGVTTVVSLGGDGEEGIRIRDEQANPDLFRARLFVAGPVISPDTPEEAREDVAALAEMGVDWVKIRVDDGLGQGTKMPREVYAEVIRSAHEHGLPLAAHLVYLEDAHGLVEEGADLLAHSVRDELVDDRLIEMMRERDVCLSPTLTRELSVFVYGERPDFFDDPFFLAEADPEVLEALEDPDRQARVRESAAAQWYRDALPTAKENVRLLHEGGVGIAMGTDSGPPARFQGYFEHLEMEMMVAAGLTPAQVIHSATGGAARCMGLDGDVGNLEPGAWADLVALDGDPLEDIRNTRRIYGVWIAGNRIR